MTDAYRPAFHFTPKRNWINDPNGLVWFEGEWHLFYQYNPHGDQWGHMSWGHAVSRNLVTWEELPVAIPEDDAHMIYSGSAVVDWENTSGLGKDGKPPLIALYTGAERGDAAKQVQCLAYSHDRGRSWAKLPTNPVLDIGLAHFRDPKIIWHAPTRRWIMVVVLAEENRARLYGSANLLAWEELSTIDPLPGTGDLWECPDFFPLPIEGSDGETRWTFKVDIFRATGRQGSAALVMTGDFDGTHFTPDARADGTPLWHWVDWGNEFYAAVSWSDVPASDGRRVWIGWMNNHFIAKDTPTAPWRGAMTVPRTLSLRRCNAGYRLVQQPVEELAGFAHTSAAMPLSCPAFDLEAAFEGAANSRFGVRIKGSTHHVDVVVDKAAQTLTIDRSQAGPMADSEDYAALMVAPLVTTGITALRIVGDACSLEVFADEGATCLTALHFLPAGPFCVEPLVLAGSYDIHQFLLKGILTCNLRP